MAVKTITITEDAYQTMKQLKGENESFSELFRRLGNRQFTIDDVAGILEENEEETEAFRKRVQEARKRIDRGFRRRIANVRARL
ncbi:MAG TPA: antitoxin VapB family protein [Candidatus Nanoarchaeia archaeon]|nr:antitoxin VapB family protein [Candidatus Nanoarchaeia archaeon]